MSIGNRIKQLRNDLGLSQGELAARCNTTSRTIQRYEANESIPKEETKHLLAKALDTTYEYLVIGKYEPRHETIDKVSSMSDKKKFEIYAEEMEALFAGGKISEKDKERVFAALCNAYFAKKKLK